MTTDATSRDAEALYRAGDYAGAAALLEPLAAASPPSPDALRMLGLCRLRQGDQGQALALLERARAFAPKDPQTALHLGLGLQAAGRHADAVPLFREAQTALVAEAAPSLNLSNALRALGDVAGAIKAARRGRLREPRMAAAHYTLGLAYLAGEFLERARESFEAATTLAPQLADAWVNLGVVRYRQGDIFAAAAAMQEALSTAPGHIAASANLGVFYRLTGRGEEAEVILNDCLARHPEAVAARLNLAAELLQEDRSEEALVHLAVPAPADPTLRCHWFLERALAFTKLGRLDKAWAALDTLGPVPPELEPLRQWRLVLLAMAEGRRQDARDAAVAMEAALGLPTPMVPEHRIMAHHELARFWSDEPARRFAHWTAAHRLLSRFQPFSRSAFAAFVDATLAGFDAARFAHGPRAGHRDEAPVFIVGMPRSGTTLLEQILSAHGAVHGAGERAALSEAFARAGGVPETAEAARRVAALGADDLAEAAARYLADLHALDPSAQRIVDKMPGNFRFLGLVGLMLPGARIIACERDPRDIGLSIFTYRFYGSHPYAHDLDDLGWYIGQQRRLMAHWRVTLPNPILTVHLSDWVEDFAGTLRRVLNFLALPYDAACETYYESDRRVRTVSRTQVRQPVHARGLGRWRRYEEQLRPLIEALQQAGAL